MPLKSFALINSEYPGLISLLEKAIIQQRRDAYVDQNSIDIEDVPDGWFSLSKAEKREIFQQIKDAKRNQVNPDE